MRVLDYYVHQGNQYEFSKLPIEYFLVSPDGQRPKWNKEHRPLRKNVHLISERAAARVRFDVVIVRSPINPKRYDKFIRSGATPIAAVQTIHPFSITSKVKHVVWNSRVAMERAKGFYHPSVNQKYIIHGFDPYEFQNLGLERNKRVLSVANLFKKRDEYLDYKTFNQISKKLKNLDVVGHGNSDIKESVGQASTFEELIEIYNTYSVYLNTTVGSACPRARAEALMTGIPVISRSNYDIDFYAEHEKNILFAETKQDFILFINKILKNEDFAEEIGNAGREMAMNHFHINDNLEKWKKLLRSL